MPNNGKSNGKENGQSNGDWDYEVVYRDKGFPKIRDTFLEGLIVRIIVFWALYWVPVYFGKLPCCILKRYVWLHSPTI